MNVSALLGSLVLALGVRVAQAPPATNPAERIVYRGDQTMEQQNAAQLACFNWSSEQTDWDPAQAYAELEREHGAALQQLSQPGPRAGRPTTNTRENSA